MQEERLDKILIQRNLVTTRTRAEQIIREVGVKVDGKLVTKTGKKFPVDCVIELVEEEIPWVSRAALKLIDALEAWSPKISKGVFLDVGASTGGFTQVLLENDAQKVYCVDVGKDQLHPKIKSDSRIINLERTHVRELNGNVIPELVDGIVMDLSFISLVKVLPFLHPLIKPDGFMIALVKPQFEVGKENIGKGGIVRDKSLYPKVIQSVKEQASLNNFEYLDHRESPILGGDGNVEFLMLLKRVTPVT